MSRIHHDRTLKIVSLSCAILSAAIIALILFFLISESTPALQAIGLWRFFSDAAWYPSDNLFNLYPMLLATIYSSLGALIIALPLGAAAALFVNYHAPPFLAHSYRRIIELLAGIPSVVFGFWGLVVLVPLIAHIEPPGASLLTGILILTLMILPTIALALDAAIKNFPKHYLLAATSLGLPSWRTQLQIVLPSIKSAFGTASILALARAMGETMAVLMVCGNIVQVPDSLFEPVRTLTANIALEMAYAMGDHRSALFVTGLLLMAFVSSLMFLINSTSNSVKNA